MKETIKFSVIMPIYNVDKYLAEAIDIMEAQTYRNFELILVDDSATDNSGIICDNYKEQFDNITVVHFPENRGVSNARNTGIECASGDYILFLDPDDKYETTLLETVAVSLNEKRVDVLVYGFTEDYYNKAGKIEYSNDHVLPTQTLTTRPEIHEMVVTMEQDTIYGYPWDKAFSARYLYECGAQFEVIPHVEDILFNISFFQNINSMTILEDKLYHYRNDGQARLTSRYFAEYFELQKRRITAFLEQQKSWGSCNERVLSTMAAVYFRSFVSFVQRELEHGRSKEEVRQMAKEEFISDLYIQLKEYAPTNGKMATFVYQPLANEDVTPAIRVAGMIHAIRKYFPFLYAKLKQNR